MTPGCPLVALLTRPANVRTVHVGRFLDDRGALTHGRLPAQHHARRAHWVCHSRRLATRGVARIAGDRQVTEPGGLMEAILLRLVDRINAVEQQAVSSAATLKAITESVTELRNRRVADLRADAETPPAVDGTTAEVCRHLARGHSTADDGRVSVPAAAGRAVSLAFRRSVGGAPGQALLCRRSRYPSDGGENHDVHGRHEAGHDGIRR
jgi:hypothetical protein